MIAITLSEALERQAAGGEPWHELLRVPDLSAGLYVLPAGGVDRQLPHTEDEVYVVLAGRARFTSGPDTAEVGQGDTLFVPAREPHRFHDIAEELRLLVVFGPAEGSRAG
jgi:mannose-6-phosphate isomerase-like protein (cupin superfamily)